MGVLNKWRDQYRMQGAIPFAVWFAKSALGTLRANLCNYHVTYVIERPLDAKIPEVHSKLPVQFVYASANDLMRFQNIRQPWRHYRKILEDRFRSGQTCLLALHENRLLGYVWVTDRPETDRNLGITVRPAAGESYGFDLYVLPEYRKDLIGIDLIRLWLHHARQTGKVKAIGMVSAKNQPMLMTTQIMFRFRRTREVRSIEFFRKWGFVIGEKFLRSEA
jgi:GNAT superfamily N-acetyltransferase